MSSGRNYIPDLLKPVFRFIRYPQQRRKWKREIKIRQSQDKWIREQYSPDEKKLVIFTIPGADWDTGKDTISGGLLSIVSLYNESRKLGDIHQSAVILCTIPGDHLLSTITSFDNNCQVFRFEQLPGYFTRIEEVIIHVPEYLVKTFFNKLNPAIDKWLSGVKFHFNILNQSVLLMPEKTVIDEVGQYATSVSVTTAHQKYCNAAYREKYGVPLHKLSVWISPEQYRFVRYPEKENLLVVPPDPHPLKETILEKLADIKGLTIQVISGMTYEEFKKLISRAKWSLTFGEGLDGYLIEPVFSGALGFAVYNEHFFTPDFKNIPGIFSSFESMQSDITAEISRLDNLDTFLEAQQKQYAVCADHYNTEVYRENIRLFYRQKYSYA
jgi:hypothetical protein